MNELYILLKIIFCVLYFIALAIMCGGDSVFMKNIIPNKIWYLLNKIRFFSPWNFFSDIDHRYYDIRITASGKNNNKYIWRLRKDKNIANITINHNLSRLTLTFYYRRWFDIFLNEYLLEQIKKYLISRSDNLELLEIEEVWYDSFDERIHHENKIFSWRLQNELNRSI